MSLVPPLESVAVLSSLSSVTDGTSDGLEDKSFRVVLPSEVDILLLLCINSFDRLAPFVDFFLSPRVGEFFELSLVSSFLFSDLMPVFCCLFESDSSTTIEITPVSQEEVPVWVDWSHVTTCGMSFRLTTMTSLSSISKTRTETNKRFNERTNHWINERINDQRPDYLTCLYLLVAHIGNRWRCGEALFHDALSSDT